MNLSPPLKLKVYYSIICELINYKERMQTRFPTCTDAMVSYRPQWSQYGIRNYTIKIFHWFFSRNVWSVWPNATFFMFREDELRHNRPYLISLNSLTHPYNDKVPIPLLKYTWLTRLGSALKLSLPSWFSTLLDW